MPIVFIAIEKADRLGLCMELRGYGSENRTYLRTIRMQIVDWAAVIFMILVVILASIAASWGFGRIDLLNL
jgi:energy-coupling factor transporter transmembrane protein EcfT